MTYWNLILREFLNRKLPTATFNFIHRIDGALIQKPIKKDGQKPKRVFYSLGPKYSGITFTEQESTAILLGLEGKSIPKIAHAMNLSPRTVEYYFSKMRYKLNCRSKAELIKKVAESDFLKNVEASRNNNQEG